MGAEATTRRHPTEATDATDAVPSVLGRLGEESNTRAEADWAERVEAAVAIRNRLGHDAGSERIAQELANRFPSASPFELRVCVASLSSVQTTDQADAPSPSPSVDAAPYPQNNTAMPDGPITGPTDPRLDLRHFDHNLLPKQSLDRGVMLAPKNLFWLWAFSASRLPMHTVDLKDRNCRIFVGDGRHKSLVVEHLRVLLALLLEAQKNTLPHVDYLGHRYLKITTTPSRLHRECDPDAPFGGSAQDRLLRYLQELADTPVVIENTATGERSRLPFLAGFEVVRRAHRTELVCTVHWYWSEAFLDSRSKGLKPFLFDVFRHIPGDINKLVYVAVDYMASQSGRSDLRLSTILERVGSLDDSLVTAPELKQCPSRQAWRLRDVERLSTLPLSNGGTLSIYRDTAQGRYDKSAEEYKLVFVTREDAIKAQQRARDTFQRLVEIALYARAIERWSQRKHSGRRAELLAAACKRAAAP